MYVYNVNDEVTSECPHEPEHFVHAHTGDTLLDPVHHDCVCDRDELEWIAPVDRYDPQLDTP